MTTARIIISDDSICASLTAVWSGAHNMAARYGDATREKYWGEVCERVSQLRIVLSLAKAEPKSVNDVNELYDDVTLLWNIAFYHWLNAKPSDNVPTLEAIQPPR